MTTVSADTLQALREFDTPTVCNVVELFNLRPRSAGYMDQSIKANLPKLPPMVGFALTSTFRAQAPPRGTDAYASLNTQLDKFGELPGPPVIVFQDLDVPSAAATFGEVMCTTYKAFGAQGLITSGTGRDLAQVEAIGFPTFTTGTACAHGYCHIPQVGVPVVVGGITVYQGDLLHGDLNGVTTIPIECASEVPGACRELMDAENIILNYLKSGSITSKGFGDARKECANVIEKIGKRLRGEK